jgi:hypothetical protein
MCRLRYAYEVMMSKESLPLSPAAFGEPHQVNHSKLEDNLQTPDGLVVMIVCFSDFPALQVVH